MKLRDYLDLDKLEEYVDSGLVNIRFHDLFPLAIYTYSRSAVLDNFWDEITTKCRGLIVNIHTGDIVARSFEKFFDYISSKNIKEVLGTSPMIFEKVNGSLGILYRFEGKEYVASKGSFHSEHAKWMTEFYQKRCPNAQWPDGYTPVFEMVCERVQKHVVNYHGVEKLVLLALIQNETGAELDYNQLYHWAKLNGLPVPKIHAMSLWDALHRNQKNEEGYVATWLRYGSTPLRRKIKFPDYLRLRRMLYHVRPKEIFDAVSKPHLHSYLKDWKTSGLPEFVEYVNKWQDIFEEEYRRIAQACQKILHAHFKKSNDDPTYNSRKEFAAFFRNADNSPYASVLFVILDGGNVKEAIWHLVEPLSKNGKAMLDEKE